MLRHLHLVSPLTTNPIKPWYPFWIILSCLIASIHWQGVYYQHDGPKWWLLDIGFAIYVSCKLLKGAPIKLSAASILCCVFVFWCFASYSWASNSYAALTMGFRYCLAIITLYFLIEDIRNKGYEHLLILCAITSSLCFFTVLVIERYLLKWPYENANFTPLGFVNHGGHVYVIWIPIFCWGVFIFNRTTQILSGLLFVACLWILAESAIRASIVGLVAACIVICFVTVFRLKHHAIRAAFIICALIAAVTMANFIQPKNSPIREKINRVAHSNNLNQVSSGRIIMYINTLDMIADNPLGVGLNNFEYIHPLYGKAGTPEASPFINEAQILRQPHNYYLKIMSETGWPGGLLIGGLLVAVVICLLKKNSKPHPWRYAYQTAIIATFINALFCATFTNPASLWFFVLLMAAYIGTLPPARPLLHFKNTARVGILGFIFAIATVGMSSADLVSQHLGLQGRLTQDTLKLQRAVHIYPGNERAWFDLATAQFEQDALPQNAIESMQHFLQLSPYHIGARYKISQWYCSIKEFKHCKAEAEHLLRFFPSFKPAQQLYFQASQEARRAP